jgi:hypothetical protein
MLVQGRPRAGAVKDIGLVDLGARLAVEDCTMLRELLEAISGLTWTSYSRRLRVCHAAS